MTNKNKQFCRAINIPIHFSYWQKTLWTDNMVWTAKIFGLVCNSRDIYWISVLRDYILMKWSHQIQSNRLCFNCWKMFNIAVDKFWECVPSHFYMLHCISFHRIINELCVPRDSVKTLFLGSNAGIHSHSFIPFFSSYCSLPKTVPWSEFIPDMEFLPACS